jgi:hypothetical protein
LNEYCERCFNRPTGGAQQWEALSEEVLLNFVDIPTMGSTDWLDQQLGVVHEREAAIWFPVYERNRNRFAWAIPYMFVDSALALAGGREVYGFPKQLGTLQIPRNQMAPSELHVNSVTLQKYHPQSDAQDYRVATVKRGGRAPRLDSVWTDPADALADVIEAIGDVAVPDGVKGDPVSWLASLLRSAAHDVPDLLAHLMFFRHLVERDAPMLLLKQFRDAHEPGAACYQAVVLVDMVVSKFRDGGLLPDGYRVEIAELDGEPISRELGIPKSSKPHLAFWIDFDFVVDLGEILWEAPLA